MHTAQTALAKLRAFGDEYGKKYKPLLFAKRAKQ
jgi:hypothetical protein